ncbi:MAG: hypothetical protein ABR505_02835, partial [Actinomycetota bacterium]
MNAAVLPVKRLSDAKRRLAQRFGEARRLQIAEALLDDALKLCHETDFLEWWVVSDDARVLDRARTEGLRA